MALGIAILSTLAWLLAGGAGALAALDPVPVPSNQGQFIRDNSAAVRLGKALFWDMQAGGDGRTACATCHFNAGADSRSVNTVNPNGAAFTQVAGPNVHLNAADFPFTSDNVTGSQGVKPSTFTGITEGNGADDQTFGAPDPIFSIGGVDVRRSTGRNTPSAINAVFNFRNFWDGRAQNDFNGVSPFGSRDAGATVGKVNGIGGVDQVKISVDNSSLASQADGPPGNPVEMSSNGRTLSDIGKKLLALQPLGEQAVSPTDSSLGAVASPSGRGLTTDYASMIRAAFDPAWWNSNAPVTASNGRTYNLMQYNFSLFWGLAIQAYESTLISDQSPFDTGTLSPAAVAGQTVFNGAGRCGTCHLGNALSSATVANVAANGISDPQLGNDRGFVDIGVRPITSDAGQAGKDPFGNTLGVSGLANVPGSFKVPILRNLTLTAPYFHNGGKLTLAQVVDFYSRGGDVANPGIQARGLSAQQQSDLVAFLESLTDPRVANQSAPFDHPELFVASGEQTNGAGGVLTDAGGRAVDCFLRVPETGSGGGAPLPQFPSFSQFSGLPCVTPPAVAHVAAAGAAPVVVPVTAPGTGTQRPPAAATSTTRCVVPRVIGKTLAQARRLLTNAHCRLGTVVRPASRTKRTLIVRTQRPAAGARRAANARVTVILRIKPKAKRKR